jgi:GGDEF domain-containing protein
MLEKLVKLMSSVSGTLEDEFWVEFLPLMRFFVRAMGADGPRRSFEDTIISFDESKFDDPTKKRLLEDLRKHAIISFINSFRFGWVPHLKVWNSAVLNEVLGKIQNPAMLPIGLIFFDVRRMKDLNKRYGHEQADLLLAKFVEVVKKREYSPIMFRGSRIFNEKLLEGMEEHRAVPIILGRVLAGDEFALIFPFSRSEKELSAPILEGYLRDIARFLEKELAKTENSLPLRILESENKEEIGTYENASIRVDSGFVLLTEKTPALTIESFFSQVYEYQIRQKKKIGN